MSDSVNILGLFALICLCLGVYAFAILGMYASWAIIRPMNREAAGAATLLMGIACFALGSLALWRTSLKLAKRGRG